MTYWLTNDSHSATLHTTTNPHMNMLQLKRKTRSLLHNYTVARYPPPPSICLRPCKLSHHQTVSEKVRDESLAPHTTVWSWLGETLHSLEWRGERDQQYVTHLTYLSQRRSTKVAARKWRHPPTLLFVVSFPEWVDLGMTWMESRVYFKFRF